jgi:hypothetical protein
VVRDEFEQSPALQHVGLPEETILHGPINALLLLSDNYCYAALKIDNIINSHPPKVGRVQTP